ncbi:MAG: alpha/beta hydrolase [Lachnospiraceae bacterium]|nr:alpha/beta hydrolase [Lachnospiraceae bacterium]
MQYNVFDMSVEGSVGNPTLTTYVIDFSPALKNNDRPMIIICPGGGYSHVSDREGELLAMQFLAAGFHTAVLKYSVEPARFPTQLKELAKAVALVRSHAEEWHIIKDKIIIQGSSAGGHLAASLGCFWKQKTIFGELSHEEIDFIRPNGLILSYPVITSGEHAHVGSFQALLGDKYEEYKEVVSLELQVNENTPKTFLWHTFEDGSVPVENTLLFIQALKKQNIPFECHIYPKGIHGLSLGNELTLGVNESELQPEVTTWVELAKTFVANF